MSDRPRIVVGRPRRWLRWALMATVVMLLVLGGWFGYAAMRSNAASDVQHAQAERDRLLNANRALRKQLDVTRDRSADLQDQLTYIKRSRQIDGDACTMVKKSLSGLQQKIAGLREQLAFYRGIVLPQQSAEGLRVYDFKVSPSVHGGRGVYDFELLLVQALHHDRRVDGAAQVQIQGLQQGEPKTYTGDDLIVGNAKNLIFSFKYFQELDGQIRLPEGFRPIEVRVMLKPEGGLSDVSRSYDWARIDQETEETR